MHCFSGKIYISIKLIYINLMGFICGVNYYGSCCCYDLRKSLIYCWNDCTIE